MLKKLVFAVKAPLDPPFQNFILQAETVVLQKFERFIGHEKVHTALFNPIMGRKKFKKERTFFTHGIRRKLP